jgi:hypothetical protein
MFNKIKSFFFPEKEESYPNEFAEITMNPVARSKGITDQYNKIIKIYKSGKLVDEKPYTEALHKVLSEEMPIFEEKIEDEEFEYYPFEDLGVSKYRK